MSIFEEIKSKLTLREVYEHYTGLKANRAGFAPCAFHSEKNASLSFHKNLPIFNCFGCGAKGDVFKLIELLFQLKGIEAVRKLNDDFCLGYQVGGVYDPRKAALAAKAERLRKEQIAEDAKRKEETHAEYLRICKENDELLCLLNELCCKPPDSSDCIFEASKSARIMLDIWLNEQKLEELFDLI